ncbi:MAG: hypothetical protein ACTSP3_08995 [Candidatus Heimdallarchaeaceae archaeon]
MSFEISPSSRAACRICNCPILKGELRYVNSFTTGYDIIADYYYHIRCVALSKPKQIGKFLSPHHEIWNQQFIKILEIQTVSETEKKTGLYKIINLLETNIIQAGDFFKGKDFTSEYAGRRFGSSTGTVIRGGYYNVLTPSAILRLDNGRTEEILSFSWSPADNIDLERGVQNALLEKSITGDNRRIIIIYKDKIIPLFGEKPIDWSLSKISNDVIIECQDNF